jgi:hypothetical protein
MAKSNEQQWRHVEDVSASKKTLISTFPRKKAKRRRPLKHGLATDEITIVGGASKTKTKTNTKKKRGPVVQVVTNKKPKTMMIPPRPCTLKPEVAAGRIKWSEGEAL